MTNRVRALAALLSLVVSTSATAQVVGHLPDKSPYVDAPGRHILTTYLGYLASVSDPGDVGPKGSVVLAASYDYDFPSAFYLTMRAGLAPTAERNVRDPLFSGPQSYVGTRRDPLMFFDMGIAASLTGEKAWNGMAPRLFLNTGFIGSWNDGYDIGEYRFGPKFNVSYGLNVRGVTGRDWEWRAELSRMLYRMNYPSSFTDGGSTIDESILGSNRKNPWAGQTVLMVGIARVWGR